MLRSYVTKKHLTFYFLAIVITWLEAIITLPLSSISSLVLPTPVASPLADFALGDWGQSGACPGLGWEALLLCSFDD